MKLVSLHPAWFELIDPEWIDALDATTFLSRCRAGTATRSELHDFVRQHHLYSKHFTRYLCALLVNVTDDDDRRELMHNLFEEMGLGAFGAVPHATIYRRMMGAMTVRLDAPAHPATLRLAEAMFECCTNAEPLVGLGALGLGAEAIVPHVYSQIIHGFEAVREPSVNLEFFRIHVEGDDEHAVTMRKIIERELARNPQGRATVQGAAKKVIFARVRFFDDISSRTNVERVREGVPPHAPSQL